MGNKLLHHLLQRVLIIHDHLAQSGVLPIAAEHKRRARRRRHRPVTSFTEAASAASSRALRLTWLRASSRVRSCTGRWLPSSPQYGTGWSSESCRSPPSPGSSWSGRSSPSDRGGKVRLDTVARASAALYSSFTVTPIPVVLVKFRLRSWRGTSQWTYDVEENLAGVDGVQQLADMILPPQGLEGSCVWTS